MIIETKKARMRKAKQREWESCQFLTDMRELRGMSMEEVCIKITDESQDETIWRISMLKTLETIVPKSKGKAKERRQLGQKYCRLMGFSESKYTELALKDFNSKPRSVLNSEEIKNNISDLDNMVENVLDEPVEVIFKEVTLNLPISTLATALDCLNDAISPKVTFTDNLDAMRSQRDEIRWKCLMEAKTILHEALNPHD